jgi:hypothetical protein
MIEFYGRWLGPFLDGHASGPTASKGFGWTRSSVTGLLDKAWQMTGVWQARRPYRMERAPFDKVVVQEVLALSRQLDAAHVGSLRDLSVLSNKDWSKAENLHRTIFQSVLSVSRLKPTAVPVAMFGSKVLHHYFPSVIPVYDDQWVKKAAMTMPAWRAFETSHDGWIVDPVASGPLDVEMVRYRRWFGGCLAGIGGLGARSLGQLRKGAQQRLDLERHPSWVASQLDAKLAEWCILGEAHHLGYLKTRSER